jgi:cytochrome P450
MAKRLHLFHSNVFEPDRWLVDGKFESTEFPMLPVSAGRRGWFGKNITMLELRIFLIMLLELSRLASS